VRVLLDAHVSGRRVGAPLSAAGHDVRALDHEPELEGLTDEEVLALAVAERRVLVTHDVADFPAILRAWAEAGRSHAGVILVHGIGHSDFRTVIAGVSRWLEERPHRDDWLDVVVALGRSS
jgi:predicted nuclease of predicted toxin-antitoxin system